MIVNCLISFLLDKKIERIDIIRYSIIEIFDSDFTSIKFIVINLKKLLLLIEIILWLIV